MDTQKLIKEALNGNQEAYTELYNQESSILRANLRRWTHTSDVDDLLQETFMQAFSKLDTYDNRAAFSTWLFRVTRNIFLCSVRRKQLTLTPLDKNLMEVLGKNHVHSDVLLAGVLNDAINKLSPVRRQVFVLHNIYEFTHEEIASYSDKTIGTSKGYNSHAKSNLRKILKKQLIPVNKQLKIGTSCAI